MGTIGEITALIKFSPKREKMLGSLIDNVEGVEETDSKGASLDKLCETRWTVRANCFQKIIDQCSSLQQLWEACLVGSLTRDMRSRIIGCQGQMKTFAFFFGLCLGQRLYSLTDNLWKAFCCQWSQASVIDKRYTHQLWEMRKASKCFMVSFWKRQQIIHR